MKCLHCETCISPGEKFGLTDSGIHHLDAALCARTISSSVAAARIESIVVKCSDGVSRDAFGREVAQ